MGDDRTRRRDPSEGQPPAAPALVLLQVAGPEAPRAFPLPVGEHVIGRDASASIRIASDDVSRRHAKVVVGRGALVNVLDLGSTNGTWVNGSRVDLRALQRGDAIALGDARLLVADADTAERVLAHGDEPPRSHLHAARHLVARRPRVGSTECCAEARTRDPIAPGSRSRSRARR